MVEDNAVNRLVLVVGGIGIACTSLCSSSNSPPQSGVRYRNGYGLPASYCWVGRPSASLRSPPIGRSLAMPSLDHWKRLPDGGCKSTLFPIRIFLPAALRRAFAFSII